MIDTLRVLQWNAARSLAAIHSLTPLIANNPQPPHLLLIQEPPWYQIGTQPSLTDQQYQLKILSLHVYRHTTNFNFDVYIHGKFA